MNSERFSLNKFNQFQARLILFLVSSLFLIYTVSNPILFSQDADFLHYIHLQSCLTDSYIVTRPTEIFLTLISKASPLCITDSSSFQRLLNTIIKIMIVLVACSHRNKVLGSIYIVVYFLLAGSAFEHHFFRQYLASYLILLLYIRNPTLLMKFFIATLVLTIHTGTFVVWIIIIIFFKLIVIAKKSYNHLITFVLLSLIFFTGLPILIDYFYLYLFLNHGFAEIGQDVSFRSQVVLVIFIFSLIGYCHMVLRKQIFLFISSIISIVVLIFSDVFGITGEFGFRVAVYVRYVFGIWLVSLFLSDLLRSIQKTAGSFKRSPVQLGKNSDTLPRM